MSDSGRVSYDPTTWKDSATGGTAITSARLNNVETGLVSATQTIDDHDDRLDALEAAAVAYAQGVASSATHGPTSSRPAPGLGTYFYDETLKQPIWGDGSGWRDASGTALTGAGASNAPQNFTAVTQPDNSILCSWTAVTGATTYKLYEAQSPSGVTGATSLTTTSTSRTPSTLRNYEYWVTATVGGVESAASNHGFATLPYSSGSGGTGTPASILNIGSGSTQNHFSVDIGYSTGNLSKTMAQIVSGFTDSPYFTPNATSTAVQFEVFANGGTTSSGTIHPRSELREVLSDGTTKASWSTGSGKTHTMSGTSTITHLPADSESSSTPKPWTCFGQIHDANGDVVRLQVEDDGGHSVSGLLLKSHTHSPNGSASTEVKTTIQSSYTVGSSIDWKIEVIDTTCNLYIGGSKKFSFTISGSGFYFKAGDYQQFSTASGDGQYASTAYARVELKNLVVTHSPAL